MTPYPTIRRCLLFDWGDTLMRDFPEYDGPMASWPRVECLPHVRTVLPALHTSWIIGLATNAQDSDEGDIRRALERGGIGDWIDEIACFRRIGSKKPSPVFFERVLHEIGLDRQRVVFVGDSFEKDIAGALKAGLDAVWFNHRRNPDTGNRTGAAGDAGKRVEMITDFRDLPNALKRLLSQRRTA